MPDEQLKQLIEIRNKLIEVTHQLSCRELTAETIDQINSLTSSLRRVENSLKEGVAKAAQKRQDKPINFLGFD